MNIIETIPVHGTPEEEFVAQWPDHEVRRETAAYVLNNHFQHISAHERTVCENFTRLNEWGAAELPYGHFVTMDILVNTYHHEII